MAHNQKLDAYPLAPGCDFFTRSTRTPCIDTGIDIDQFTPNSRVYVSEDTVGEWARMLGWISPDQAEELRAEVTEAAADLADAEDELHRLRVIEAALLAGGFVVPEPEDIPITQFPHAKGGGWWLFSDGTTKRCTTEDAERTEAEIEGHQR